MAKRKNGEGTWGTKVIKGVEYKFYRNSDGKYFYGRTQKDVKEKIKNYNPQKTITPTEISKQTFGDYISNWLLELKMGDVKHHTLDGYENCILSQLINYKYHDLANIQVGAITTDIIIDYYKSLTKHYAKSTIKKNYAILSQCILYGNKKHHFKEVVDLSEIKLPHEDVVAHKKREIHFLTEEDMNKLYAESQRINTQGFNFGGKLGESTYGVNALIIIFIAFTGLRISEAIELTWDNVDLANKKIYVRKNAVRIKDRTDNAKGKYKDHISDPKSYAGERVIPLNNKAIEMLEKAHLLNTHHKKNDYVFITSKGGKIKSRQNVNRTLNAMITRAGCSITECSPHELRHSFGSLLLKKGVDIKIVSKLLGHSDISVTYNVYIHILEEQEIDAVNVMNMI